MLDPITALSSLLTDGDIAAAADTGSSVGLPFFTLDFGS